MKKNVSLPAKMEKIYGMHKLVGLQLFWSRTPTFSSGTPTFCQMGVLNSCFQNPSESSVGDKPFSKDKEQKLVDHITYMADIGYGYNKANIQHMAKDYTDSLGKNVKTEEKLSSNWFYGFIDRRPNLRVLSLKSFQYIVQNQHRGKS